jgi:hypothetical protein
VVYGTALEKRQWLCRPLSGVSSIYIWLCHPVLLGAKQFVGKTATYLENCQGAFEGQKREVLGKV